MSVDRDVVWVGSAGDDDAGIDSGSAYMFRAASRRNYGEGWPGTNRLPQLTASGKPDPGSTITLSIENSLGTPTIGIMAIGMSWSSQNTAFGGSLLVTPDDILPVSLPAAGLSLPADIPADFVGTTIFLQCLEQDPGASRGVSFTPGLVLNLCGF